MKQQVNKRFIIRASIISAIVTSFMIISACSETGSATTDRDPAASATYKVTLTTSWDAAKFPTNFPAGPHFSSLTGATHNEQVIFWQVGQFASNGIEFMAETGSQGSLVGEVESEKADGKAQFVLSGPGAGAVDSVSVEFDINPEYPLVTLVSMVAPSPDWYVGVQNLSLFDGATNDWKASVTVDLAVYDAGTDSGRLFTSGNSDTQPAETIALLSSEPAETDFSMGVSGSGEFIAVLNFERIN